mmetsp:Transcript_13699/g.13496  ORF Transcript_13699/g.13496 Transcript_13699/m.13496 type:complete len:209 (-) Transcript_13699:217-843(-)
MNFNGPSIRTHVHIDKHAVSQILSWREEHMAGLKLIGRTELSTRSEATEQSRGPKYRLLHLDPPTVLHRVIRRNTCTRYTVGDENSKRQCEDLGKPKPPFLDQRFSRPISAETMPYGSHKWQRRSYTNQPSQVLVNVVEHCRNLDEEPCLKSSSIYQETESPVVADGPSKEKDAYQKAQIQGWHTSEIYPTIIVTKCESAKDDEKANK